MTDTSFMELRFAGRAKVAALISVLVAAMPINPSQAAAQPNLLCCFAYLDNNGNGTHEEGSEPLLSGWEMCFDGPSGTDCMVTGESGGACRPNLIPGDYEVCVTVQTGYVATTPECQIVTMQTTGVTNLVFGVQLIIKSTGQASVIAAGGDHLGGHFAGVAVVAEAIVHPLSLSGNGFTLHPGFIAKTKLTLLVPADVNDLQPALPVVSRLHGNFPNPFEPSTTIRFALASAGPASLRIYDVNGRLVRMLMKGPLEAGSYDIRWDGRDDGGSAVSSGVYFMHLEARDFNDRKKLILLR